MDRQAFRNRMQQLKQYREQNPGKTYLDFKKYVEGRESTDDRTDHSVKKPIIPEYIERTVDGKKWSSLTSKEQFQNRVGFYHGVPSEKGLEIVSPEFEILVAGRQILNSPKYLYKALNSLKASDKEAVDYIKRKQFKDVLQQGKQSGKVIHSDKGNLGGSAYSSEGALEGAQIKQNTLYPGRNPSQQEDKTWWFRDTYYREGDSRYIIMNEQELLESER